MKSLELPADGIWRLLRDVLNDGATRQAIDTLRPARLSPLVPPLRLMGVAVGMTYSESKRAKATKCQSSPARTLA